MFHKYKIFEMLFLVLRLVEMADDWEDWQPETKKVKKDDDKSTTNAMDQLITKSQVMKE